MTVWKPSRTPEDVLMHSTKGSTWSKHKYIRKEGNKYIYKEGTGVAAEKKRPNDITDIPQRENSMKMEGHEAKDIDRLYKNEYAMKRGMPTPGDDDELEYAYKSKKAALDTGWAFLDDKDRDIIRKKYENMQSAKRKKRVTAADRKRLRDK